MKPAQILITLILCALVLAGGWYGVQWYQRDQYNGGPLIIDGAKTLPAFRFVDLDGVSRDSTEWQGQILIVNFWATWCPPCRQEMPLFVELQEKYRARGLQIVGIAIDDPDLVRDFADVYGINFPVLIGSADAIRLANTLGNRFDSLPFTAVFDRNGNTHYVQVGEIKRDVLEKQLASLL